VAAGRGLGLTVSDPQVLYDVFSVVVHLRPAPVVVRVPTVLPRTVAADPGEQAAQQRRELDVAAWLAARGHPVVAPSPLVPPEPVSRDGFSMTFWQHVEQVPGDPMTGLDDPHRLRLAARLHAALHDYPGELRFLMPLDASIPDGLAQLEQRPDLLDAAGLERARAEWAALEQLTDPDTFAATFPGLTVQPIHGDAPTYNLIVTPDGELASDFEHVTRGPIEWDLVHADAQARATYDAEAARLGLRPVDERLLRVMEAARMIQLVACLPMAPQLPILFDGVSSAVQHWRESPPLSLG
jgi:Ser/Thr protein kinase RdoA (MazF antagonist)